MKKTPYLWLLGLLFASAWYVQQGQEPVLPPGVSRPATPQLTRILPDHLSYDGIQAQLLQWQSEAPGLAQLGQYGRSSKGKPLAYLRITNLQDLSPRPCLLIHAALHGNEPLSTSVVLGYMGKLLSLYGQDPEITELVNTRDLYFAPAVSPDSYPNSRYVDGRDPNRVWDQSPTIAPVAALQDLFQKIHPVACWSGHTSGRMFLRAPGQTSEPSQDEDRLASLFSQIADLAQYKSMRASELYGHPIQGSEVDFYYKHGALASCVCEYGLIQRPATPGEIKIEVDRTWKAFLLWIKKAPDLLSMDDGLPIIRTVPSGARGTV